MRYWSFLALKLAASLVVPLLLWLPVAHHLLANQPVTAWPVRTLVKLSTIPFWVGFCVLLHFSLRDHRFRCRVCLRRLRMPVSNGSYAALLLNRPGTEYICPFGHGKLYVLDTEPGGYPLARWTRSGDIWHELTEDRKQ